MIIMDCTGASCKGQLWAWPKDFDIGLEGCLVFVLCSDWHLELYSFVGAEPMGSPRWY